MEKNVLIRRRAAWNRFRQFRVVANPFVGSSVVCSLRSGVFRGVEGCFQLYIFFSFCCRSIWRECSENAKKNRSPRVPSGSVSAAPCVVRPSRVWCVHHRRSKLRRLLHLSSRWGWGRAHCSSSSAGRGSFWESFFFLGGGTVNETHELEEGSGGEKKR